MKKACVFTLATIVILFSSALAFSADEAKFKATASDVVGEPEVTPAGAREALVIKNGTTVSEGDTILAGFRERLTLKFDDGSVAFIKPLSEIVLSKSYVEKQAARIHLKLTFGAVRATVPRKEAKTDFSISTPTVTCSVKGTEIKEVRANVDMPDTIMMGRTGWMYVKRNPGINLGANEGTNSNLNNPIDEARDKSLVKQTQEGTDDEEEDANKDSSTPLYPNPADYKDGQGHAKHQAGWMPYIYHIGNGDGEIY